jgi:aryl-alcohol dehydrogenase-like predicted oxidoreductase
MQQRAFGNDDTKVSEVGLGTWQLGGSWSEVDDASAARVLETAVARGIDFFDTADVYGDGRSETRIGDFLRAHGARVFVATKLGRGGNPGWPANFSREVFFAHAEASRRRLRVDALDLIQMHCLPADLLRAGECFDWLRAMQSEGLVRRWGASVETMDEALTCLAQPGLAALQIIFNIYRQKPIDVLFEAARAKNVALIVRLPLASGLLSGKFTARTTFAPDDHRNFNRDGQSFNVGETFAGIPFEKGVELTEELKTLVPADIPLSRLALRWILDHEAVTVIIPGATRPAQVDANADASETPALSAELHAKLRTFYRERVAPHIRGPY